MAVVRIDVDEDTPEAVVTVGLRARGVDMVTHVEATRRGTSDVEQLEFAT